MSTSTQWPLTPWAITNSVPLGTANHATPLSTMAPLNSPNLMAYGQNDCHTTSSSINNTILTIDVLKPHKNEPRPPVQRCIKAIAFHPGTRSSMQRVTMAGGTGGEQEDDNQYRCFWKSIKNHYLEDPNDDTLASIVENSYDNQYLKLTAEELEEVNKKKNTNMTSVVSKPTGTPAIHKTPDNHDAKNKNQGHDNVTSTPEGNSAMHAEINKAVTKEENPTGAKVETLNITSGENTNTTKRNIQIEDIASDLMDNELPLSVSPGSMISFLVPDSNPSTPSKYVQEHDVNDMIVDAREKDPDEWNEVMAEPTGQTAQDTNMTNENDDDFDDDDDDFSSSSSFKSNGTGGTTLTNSQELLEEHLEPQAQVDMSIEFTHPEQESSLAVRKSNGDLTR